MSSIAAFSRTSDVGLGKGIFALADVDLDSIPVHDDFFSDQPPSAAQAQPVSSMSAQDFDFVNVDLSASARKRSVFEATHNAFFSKSSETFFKAQETTATASPEPAPSLRRKTRNRSFTTRGDAAQPGMQRSTSSHNLRSSFKRQQAMAGSRSAHASPAASPVASPTSSPPSSPTPVHVNRVEHVPAVAVPPSSPTPQPRPPTQRSRSFTIGMGLSSTTVSTNGASIPKIIEGRQRRPKKVLEAVSADKKKRESLMAMTLGELQAHLKELRAQLAEQNAIMLEQLELREELTCDKEILTERLDYLKETPTPGGLTVPY